MPHGTFRTCLLSGLMLGLLAAPGCNIVAPVYYLVHGPEKVKASYTLDKKASIVVFIDDRGNSVPRRALRVTIGEEAEKELLKQKVVADMISTQSALAAAGTDKAGQPMSTTEIGESVKAQFVIYATVDSFSLSPDGSTFAPTTKLRVKVVDVAKDTRLWPEEPRGFPLVVRLNAKAQELPTGTSARYQAEDELAAQAGLELAQLFYDHELAKGIKVPE